MHRSRAGRSDLKSFGKSNREGTVIRHLIFASMTTAALCFAPAPAGAQVAALPGAAASAAAPAPPVASHDMSGHAGHDMSSMATQDPSSTAHALPMKSALGPYSMAREGSGTSWEPDATPMRACTSAPSWS